MADNKVLQTRIKLKIDTLAKWQEIWETFIPLKGEKILFQIPSGDPQTVEGNGITPPQVISKTGDGDTPLNRLPWDSALAADVAAWAKPGDSSYVNVPTLKTDVTNLQTAIPQTYATKTELDTAKSNLSKEIDGDIATARGLITKEIDDDITAAKNTLIGDANTPDTILGVKKVANDAVTAANNANNNANTRVLTTTYNADQKAQDDRLTTLEGKIGGVTGAMHFIGAFASAPSKNGTDALKAGDVYINTSNNKEFVYSGSAWVELGDTTAEAQAITNLQTAVKAIQNAPYATTGNIATAKSELIGKSDDAATANTIYGAKQAAADVLGKSGDAATANTVYGVKAAVTAEKARAEQAETNLSTTITNLGKKLTTVSTTLNNGLTVTPTTNGDGAKDYKVDIDDSVIFVFDCGSATVNAQNITK